MSSSAPKDQLGREFKIGDRIAKPCSSSRARCDIEIRTIEDIKGEKVYCDGSKGQCLRYPELCIIITKLFD